MCNRTVSHDSTSYTIIGSRTVQPTFLSFLDELQALFCESDPYELGTVYDVYEELVESNILVDYPREPYSTIDLQSFGQRVLTILSNNGHLKPTRIPFVASDVLLFVGKSKLTQSDVDSLSDDGIHGLIREACQSAKTDAWREVRENLGTAIGELVSELVQPEIEETVELSQLDRMRIEIAWQTLGSAICADISAGYSIREIERRAGLPVDRVRNHLRLTRKIIES